MWVVNVRHEDGVKDVRYVVTHRDGSNPKSICQALRLVREHLVRIGMEDRVRITTAVFEDDLSILAPNGEAS